MSMKLLLVEVLARAILAGVMLRNDATLRPCDSSFSDVMGGCSMPWRLEQLMEDIERKGRSFLAELEAARNNERASLAPLEQQQLTSSLALTLSNEQLTASQAWTPSYLIDGRFSSVKTSTDNLCLYNDQIFSMSHECLAYFGSVTIRPRGY